ncbi:MAG: hypothetical protein JSR76_07345 [Verrucomicrobia bacterium]|nr:hypothetical protein [Verrucomicrobiota bacterium]
MYEDNFSNKWHQLKHKVKEKWSKLTDQDLSKINGNKEHLYTALKEKYGLQRQRAEEELHRLEQGLHGSAPNKRENLHDSREGYSSHNQNHHNSKEGYPNHNQHQHQQYGQKQGHNTNPGHTNWSEKEHSWPQKEHGKERSKNDRNHSSWKENPNDFKHHKEGERGHEDKFKKRKAG